MYGVITFKCKSGSLDAKKKNVINFLNNLKFKSKHISASMLFKINTIVYGQPPRCV